MDDANAPIEVPVDKIDRTDPRQLEAAAEYEMKLADKDRKIVGAFLVAACVVLILLIVTVAKL